MLVAVYVYTLDTRHLDVGVDGVQRVRHHVAVGLRADSARRHAQQHKLRRQGDNIVKLRQGSGKDWQGMAVKVKGLKA